MLLVAENQRTMEPAQSGARPVQRHGGEILKTPLPEGDHFYNRIEGRRVDLTESQFATPVNYLDMASDRSEALAGTSVSNYEVLRATFFEHYTPSE
jgi:hypothetical protein